MLIVIDWRFLFRVWILLQHANLPRAFKITTLIEITSWYMQDVPEQVLEVVNDLSVLLMDFLTGSFSS
jgi:uncharacterized protein YqcC (DUF446 family)